MGSRSGKRPLPGGGTAAPVQAPVPRKHAPPRPGTAPQQAPSAHVRPSGGGDVRLNAVQQMQQELLNLSSTMAKNYLMTMNPKSDAKGGSDPFGNFLVKQYIKNEDVVGKQFVNVDAKEPTRSGTAMENAGLRGVISTMGRVGTPGTERKVDGIWKTRTDNALKQASAVAASLVQLQKDMNIQVEGYTQKDLDALRSNIPEVYTQLGNTAEQRAAVIAENLKKLTGYYTNFETAVLNNEKYKSFITQQKPFTIHGKGEQLSKEDEDFMMQHSDTPIPNVNIGNQPVTLGDLRNADAFKALLGKANIAATSQTLPKYIKQVESLINASRPADITGE